MVNHGHIIAGGVCYTDSSVTSLYFYFADTEKYNETITQRMEQEEKEAAANKVFEITQESAAITR